jgi:flagellar hook-associated protein 3 FlgL
MRVTEALISQFINQANTAAKSAVFKATQKVVSGKKLESPSEDLVSAQRILHLDGILEELDHFDRARAIVQADLDATDTVAFAAINTMTNALETAVQMANDTVNPDDRVAEAEAVESMREHILDLANTKLSDGRFLFSGMAEDIPPFDENGVYQGSTDKRTVEVMPGFRVEQQTLGTELFGDPSIIKTLDLFVTALQANDTVTISQMITELDDAIHSMSLEHVSIGGRLKNVKETEVLLEDLTLRTQIQRAESQDVDLASAITELNTAELAMSAAIEASKRLIGASALRWLS